MSSKSDTTSATMVTEVTGTGVPRLTRWFLPPSDTGQGWWRVLRWPVALLFVFVGVVTIGASIMVHVDGVASEAWPTTTGQVIDTTIEEGRTSASRRSGRRAQRSRAFYKPRVRYTYTVDDRSYRGDRIALDVTTYRTYDEAAAVTARYLVGAEVSVFYDPAHSEQAVLEPGPEGSDTVLGLMVGVAASGGGLLFLRFGHLRPLQFRRPRPPVLTAPVPSGAPDAPRS
jgi:hypothetical protein